MNTFNMKAVAAAIVVCFGIGGPAWAVNSSALKETIKKGEGEMKLSDSQVKDLASYVAEYNKPSPTEPGRRAISFGVDINESANGTEKASSQAVTVEFAWLEVKTKNSTKRYGKAPSDTKTEEDSDFYTETQAWVVKKDSTKRQKMYTLLGRTGSAQITGGSDIQNNYDSTLKIVIPDGVDLSDAIEVELKVLLADLNVKLGDPEQFYDFTGGFEDVALLNETDSKVVDNKLGPRDSAPGLILSKEGTNTQTFNNQPAPVKLSWIQKPGAGNYNIAAYEDLYPRQGDYDFNDLVVAYSYSLGVNSKNEVESMNGQAYILARGAAYTHNWTLTLNLPSAAAALESSSCETVGYKSFANGKTTSRELEVDTGGCTVSVNGNALNWQAFTDSVKLFPANLAGQRRVAAQPFFTDNYFVSEIEPAVKEPKATFSVTFKTPIPLAKFGSEDPWIRVTRSDNSKTDIRLSLRDSNNFPYVMLMPTSWQWPRESTSIDKAYPEFFEFVKSSGTEKPNWYKNFVPEHINQRDQSVWAW